MFFSGQLARFHHWQHRDLWAFCKWVALSVLVGSTVGLVSSAFAFCLSQVTAFRQAHFWILFCLPLAGLVILALYHILNMDNDGGTEFILASVRDARQLHVRQVPLIFIATVLTHLTGGSAGREGAALQIGGSMGNKLGQLLHLDDRDERMITMAGMAAGFSALFGTPIGAAVFAMEVESVGVMYYSAIVPCFLSALVAKWVASALGIAATGFTLASAPHLTPLVLLQLLALGVLLLRDGPLCIRKPGSWRITSACLRNLWRVGTPLAAERAALSSAQVLLVRIVSGLGTVAIAANSLGVSAEGLCYMAGYGIQDASIALIGQAVGAHRRDMAKRFAWLCTMMGIGIMALSGVGLWLFAPALMGIFTADAAVIALGAQVLRIEAFAEPMFGASIVASGAMQGAGDSTGCFVLNLVSMWGIRLTLASLLAPHFGLVGVWMAMSFELTMRGVLFLVRLARGRWLDKGALA